MSNTNNKASETSTGGPAFPFVLGDSEMPIKYEPGMTLRDYFAAKAMQSCPLNHPEDAALWCYRRADAMLRARGAEKAREQ